MTEEEKRKQQAQQNNTPAPAVQETQQNNQQSTTPAPDTYNQAMSALQTNSKPVYNASYDAQINDLYNKIVNREAFSYDYNADALFQQAKDNYVNMGRLAMRDTLGQASALTGGYGSTYGQALGQQAYDASLQQLYDQMPAYYDRAYQLYQGEGDSLMQQYGMLGDLAADEYGKYQDAYNQYMNERDYNYARLMDMINATGYAPTADEINAAGMTQAQVDQLLKAWRIQNPGLYAQMTGNTGGSSGGYVYNPQPKPTVEDGNDINLELEEDRKGIQGAQSEYERLYNAAYREMNQKASPTAGANISAAAANSAINQMKQKGYTDAMITQMLKGK